MRGTYRKYNRQLTIQIKTDTVNASGQKIGAWTDMTSRWAEVKPSGGSERSFAGIQTIAEVTHRVELRHDAVTEDLHPEKHRLRLDGKVLNIVRSYDPTGLRRVVQVECLEEV